jgi:hypothetical protein
VAHHPQINATPAKLSTLLEASTTGVARLATYLDHSHTGRTSQFLPLARWVGLIGLLVAEALVLGLRFDG